MSSWLVLLMLAADPDLETLVERFYLGAKAVVSENCLHADQQAWRQSLKSCSDAACLKRAQLERLAALQALQESVPKDLDLPEVPQLLWAAGESRSGGTPLRIEGRLEYRGGYYLRADDGKSYLLADDLSLRGASAEQLREIRNESRGARLMARGTASRDASRPGFEAGNCVFLYVLP
jgi:hypothetical protein